MLHAYSFQIDFPLVSSGAHQTGNINQIKGSLGKAEEATEREGSATWKYAVLTLMSCNLALASCMPCHARCACMHACMSCIEVILTL